MTIYYPYVLIETNIDPKNLNYDLRIVNITTKKPKKTSNRVNRRTKLTQVKKGQGSSKIYQTEYIEIDSSNIEIVRDLVIIFSLYRISNNHSEVLVIDNYILPYKVEQFIKASGVADISPVHYKETKKTTTQITYDSTKNEYILKLSNNRIFQCLDEGHKIGQTNDPFTKEIISAGVQARLNEPNPNQDLTSLCGAAAYFFLLINILPHTYRRVVKELWETGQTKVGNLTIKPKVDGCRKVRNFFQDGTARIPPIDWITLASLRESENQYLKLSDLDDDIFTVPEVGIKSTTDQLASITNYPTMNKWLSQSGFNIQKVYDFKIAGFSEAEILEMSTYVGKGNYIVTLISDAILEGGGSYTSLTPGHWVVWTDQLRLPSNIKTTPQTLPITSGIQLKLFSWGENKNQLKKFLSLVQLARGTFYAIVVKKSL